MKSREKMHKIGCTKQTPTKVRKVLDMLEQENAPTQAYIASQLNISASTVIRITHKNLLIGNLASVHDLNYTHTHAQIVTSGKVNLNNDLDPSCILCCILNYTLDHRWHYFTVPSTRV